MTIVVLNKHHKIEDDGSHVYVGRPHVLGNKWSHLNNTQAEYKVSSRDEAVEEYDKWLRSEININPDVTRAMKLLYNKWQKEGTLKLVCWCAPARCHGDVIKTILEEKRSRDV